MRCFSVQLEEGGEKVSEGIKKRLKAPFQNFITLEKPGLKKCLSQGGFPPCGASLCNRQDLISAEKKVCEWFTHGLQPCPR